MAILLVFIFFAIYGLVNILWVWKWQKESLSEDEILASQSLLAAMADYFDEMGWEPVALEETQRHQIMLMVRALLDHGFFPDDMLQGERLAPPASKEVVRNLPERKPTPEDESCSICLKPNSEHPDIFKILPCSHEFHQSCILPWLNQTNSCPLCRFELKTDDSEYEERKKFLQRQREREEDLEGLHNSMFG